MRAPPRAIPNEADPLCRPGAVAESENALPRTEGSAASDLLLPYDLLHYVAKHTARFSGRLMYLPASERDENRNQDQEDDHHDHQQTNYFSYRAFGHPFRRPRPSASLAGEVNESQTFKRFQGLSFEAGQSMG